MAPLTAERPMTGRLGEDAVPPLLKVPVAASTKIFAGSMVMIDAGYAKPAAAATGKKICGRAEKTVDNTNGSAGAVQVVVRRGPFGWDNGTSGDAIAQADVGKVCYAIDDHTVGKTDGTGARSPAGVILQLEGTQIIVETGVNLLLTETITDAT